MKRLEGGVMEGRDLKKTGCCASKVGIPSGLHTLLLIPCFVNSPLNIGTLSRTLLSNSLLQPPLLKAGSGIVVIEVGRGEGQLQKLIHPPQAFHRWAQTQHSTKKQGLVFFTQEESLLSRAR